MEVKSFHLEKKRVSLKERIIEGYAATWDQDQVNDIITKGAFAKSIRERFPAGKIKLLYQHDAMNPIGKPIEMMEDDYGLFVKAKVSKTRLGDEVLELAGDEVIDCMSIGYSAVNGKVDFSDVDGDPVRILREVKLYEFSPVTFPANEGARISAVKHAMLFDSIKKGDTISPQDLKLLAQHVDSLHALVADFAKSMSRNEHSEDKANRDKPQGEKSIEPEDLKDFHSELDNLINWAKTR